MRTGFEFKPDNKGIENVLEGPGVARALDTVAEEAASKMRSMAPRGFFDFKKRITTRKAKKTGAGLAAAVGSDSPGWHLQEFGTARQPPRATIRKALRSMSGIKFEEGSR